MKLNMAAKKRREAYIFILPGFIYLVAICGYPLIYNLILSFKNVNVKNLATGASVFVGLDNYKQLFADPTFQLVFKNTIEFTLACLVVQFTIGFLFAMFFSKKFTLAGKEYHEGENPVNNLSFIQEYDVYTPGQDFLFTSKDNIFVAWKVGEPVTKMQYIRKSVLQYEKEWLNGLTWKSWIMNQNNEAAGTLQYIKRDESGNLYHIKDLSTINGVIRPGIVHRLDKDTSGVIVVAKNDEAHGKLSEMFKEKTLEKIYVCIAKGIFKEKSGRIKTLIGRDSRDRKKMAVVNENGKIAISNYEVIDEGKNHSLVKVRIETGRTHQIRVHMKHLNHPIMGDTTYGNGNDGADRQMLHAYRLKFIHPTKNTEMTVIAPLPEDFKRAAKHVGVDISKIESEIKNGK